MGDLLAQEKARRACQTAGTAKGVVVKRFPIVLATMAIAALVVPASARAELLRITPEGEDVKSYSGPTDPVPIGSDGFRLTFHGGGSDTLVDPVLLILGIPNATGSTVAPTITDSGLSDPAALSASVDIGGTTNLYGGTWNTTTGFAGIFDSSAGSNSVYEFIGLTPDGSDSQSYINWSSQGDTSWGLFVYALTFTPDFSAGDWIEFLGTLPIGTYVVGYGCESPLSGGHCSGKGTTQSTPFTFAGYVVPEPGTLSLLASGVAFVFGRRRNKK